MSVSDLSVEEDGSLICTIYGGNARWNREFHYSVRLMQLNGNEFQLSHGRFRTFRLDPQQHHVMIHFTTQPGAKPSLLVQWIADNSADALWSMRGQPIDVANFDLDFSFADGAMAAFFALSWW